MSDQESTEQESTKQKADVEPNNEHQDLVGGTKDDTDTTDEQNNNEEGGNIKNKEDDIECNNDEDQEDTDRKAKDDKGLLSRLSSRIGVGGEVAKKVGRRGFERPNVAISNRIYEQYDVPDPWAPKSKKKSNKWETRLGVSLKLGEAKRQPGRHLMPKEPKKKAIAKKQTNPAESFKPKGIPQAAKTKPKPPPPPPPKPERASTFGGPKKHGVVGKIPIRPDLQGTQSESRPTSPTANSRNSKARPVLKKTSRTASASQTKNMTATQQEIERRSALFGQSTSENTSSNPSKSRRLKRTKATQRPPKVTKIDQPQSSQSTPVVEAPPEPPPRSVKPASQPSMDDIFGGSISKENRPRLGRRKKRS